MSRKQSVAGVLGSVLLAVGSVTMILPLVAEGESQQPALQEDRGLHLR
jgi:hypothetical protein